MLNEGFPGPWLTGIQLDASLLLPLLLAGPFCWGWTFSRGTLPAVNSSARWIRWGVVGLTGLLAWVAGARTATLSVESTKRVDTFADVIPLVHDEFSYQLQARTFLAGKWFLPGPAAAPEIFHQLHVLNEGKFASRYPPGTGLWLLLWEGLGRVNWGPRCAHAVTAMMLCLIGCELGSLGLGALAGVLWGLAPGPLLFSQLLLSHGPAQVGLVIWLWGVFRIAQRPTFFVGLIAGTGFALCALSRPMTALAIGIPSGIWLAAAIVRGPRIANDSPGSRWRCAAGLALPLVLGGLLQVWQNVALTGSPARLPYSLYTDLYTPRHVYGFDNGEQSAVQPRLVLSVYDDWAKNLDAGLAARNVKVRLRESLRYTLGIVPLVLVTVILLGTWRQQDSRIRLLLFIIASLHIAHIPYWLDGILGYHYVYETGPLWILIFAAASQQGIRLAMERGALLFPAWWLVLVSVSITLNLLPLSPGSPSRLQRGTARITAAAGSRERFDEALRIHEPKLPCLILVEPGPDDLHTQYVQNEPPFTGPLLIGHFRPELYPADSLQQLFPDRTLYYYDGGTGRLRLLTSDREASP